jgi:hypothetical protein
MFNKAVKLECDEFIKLQSRGSGKLAKGTEKVLFLLKTDINI